MGKRAAQMCIRDRSHSGIDQQSLFLSFKKKRAAYGTIKIPAVFIDLYNFKILTHFFTSFSTVLYPSKLLAASGRSMCLHVQKHRVRTGR